MLLVDVLFYLVPAAYAGASGAIGLDVFSKDPILLAPGEAQAQLPHNLTSDASGLQKRDVGCYFQGTSGSYCDGAQICCYNFETGDSYGGFCCANDGRCCGNGCCKNGYGCAYADHTTFQCCLDSEQCGITTTVTETDYATVVNVQTTVDVEYSYITDYETQDNTVVATRTEQNTIHETKTQQNTITKEASTVVLTQIFTSINSAGETVIQTSAVESVVSAAPATSNTAECVHSQKKDTNIGAIVGGVVGGVVFLALLAAFLFVGARKGWFDKKEPTYPPVPAPVPTGGMAANNQPKNYYQGPEAVPVSPVSSDHQPVSYRNTMTPVPPYQPQPGYPQRPSYINEMEGTGHSYEMPGSGQPYH